MQTKVSTSGLISLAFVAGLLGGAISSRILPSYASSITTKRLHIVDDTGTERGRFSVANTHVDLRLFSQDGKRDQVRLMAHNEGEGSLELDGTRGEIQVRTHKEVGEISMNEHTNHMYRPIFTLTGYEGGSMLELTSRTHLNTKFSAYTVDDGRVRATIQKDGETVWQEPARKSSKGSSNK